MSRNEILTFEENADLDTIQENELFGAKEDFDELISDPILLNNLVAKGFKKPSHIQAEAIPKILSPSSPNYVIQSQNGTGKTLVFVLSVLSKVNFHDPTLQAIIISPNSQLAKQTYDLLLNLSGLKPPQNQEADYAKLDGIEENDIFLIRKKMIVPNKTTKPKIIVADLTLFLDKDEQYSWGNSFEWFTANMLVFDEADQSIDDLHSQLPIFLSKCTKAHLQILLVSATYNAAFEDLKVTFLKATDLNSVNVNSDPDSLLLNRNKHYAIKIVTDTTQQEEGFAEEVRKMKFELIYNLLLNINVPTLVLAQEKATIDELFELLRRLKRCDRIRGSDTDPVQANQMIERLKNDDTELLISTPGQIGRGVDIPNLKLVINFDMPVIMDPVKKHRVFDEERYIHCQGRTGRFGKTGKVYNFVAFGTDLFCIKILKDKYHVNVEEYKSDELMELIDSM